MQELRFVAVSEDGSYAVLAVPGRSGRYILPIDERLRAVALGQTSRLAQYEIEVESPLRPKEIQARIRAGETAEEIADAAGIPVERVRWFEGPVLAERAYIAEQAQSGSVRRAGDSAGPGPRLGEIVTARLSAAGTDPADGQWDSRKRGDGNWQVSLTFPSGGRLHVAEWVFDPRRRHVLPDDDNAARLSLPESELPPEPVSLPGEATVTPIASRLGAAAGMGGGPVPAPGGYPAGSGMSRFRPERSVIPDRSLGADRSLADRPAAPSLPAPERSAGAERAVTPRPDRADRAGHQERSASYGYAEFPESAPYRSPAPAPEPSAYRPPAHEPSGYRAPAGPPAYADSEADSHGHGDQFAYRTPAPPGTRAPEAAAHRAPSVAEPPAVQVPPVQAAAASALDDPERVRPARPRHVIFEDPEPALGGEQHEPARAAQSPVPASGSASDSPVGSAPAGVPAPGQVPVIPETAAAYTPVTPAPQAQAQPAAPTEPASPAATAQNASPAVPETPVTLVAEAGTAGSPGPAATPAPTPAALQPATAQPVAAQPVAAQPVTAQPVAEPVAARPAAAQPAAAQPAAVHPAAQPVDGESAAHEPMAASAGDSAEGAAPAAVASTADSPEAAPATEPADAGAAEPAAAGAEPAAEVPAPATPPVGEEQAGRQRPGAKKNAKARRSSVPSWDEIMLGSSRQRD